MGADKGGMKSSGFFHLFDWNRKSRKKLFSSVSPEGTKQGKRRDENLPAAPLRLVVDDDEVVGVTSVKGSSDYSCASSVTDEEGNGVRVPGVVARLMGLDSMPIAGVPEPYSTPLFDTRSLKDNHSHKRSPEFYINDQFNHALHRGEVYSRKPMQLRSQKMPSSPIERFQTEILPPRSAKSFSMAHHHRLLSPIKNSGFISPKNAAHIMEAAAKILEPGLQGGTKGKDPSFGSSSIPLKVRNSKESLAASQRTSRILDPARTPIESTDMRYLRGQPLTRSWNGSENTAVFRNSPDFEESNSCAKGKGKSISLAIQAKVNVQRREGLSTASSNTLDQRDHGECKLDQPFKSQPNNQKSKTQKKPLTANASGVLSQNNQKQNCPLSKGKIASKQSIPNQQGRKVLSGDASSGKNKTVNRISGNSRVGYRKDGLEVVSHDREGSSYNNKDFPQKKRLIDRGFHSDKSGFTDNILVGRNEKYIQPNVVSDEHLRWTEDNRRDAMDVVSFTFTSPLIKPMHGSRSLDQVVEKPDKRNTQPFDTNSEKNASDSKDKRLLSLELNKISGDALSLLLEQKLRELTSGFELSNCSFLNAGSCSASVRVTRESASTSDTLATAETECGEFLLRPCKDKPNGTFGYGVSSTNGQVFGMTHKPRGVEDMECSSSSDARKETDHQHPSPLSVFEASFSHESCNSTESSGSTNETKLLSSSIQAQNAVSTNYANKIPSTDLEMDLLDSASSSFTETVDGECASEIGTGNMKACKDDLELEYVRELLQNTGLVSKDIGACYFSDFAQALDPHRFDILENKRWSGHGEDKESRLTRKVVFDCVNECLDLRCSRYFRAGYQAWAKGCSVIGKDLADELYQEISGWKSMGDWMVDELVDKDMSSHLGRWLDFEIEAFQIGLEIEREMLSSMIDEVVGDFLTEEQCR